MAIRRYTPGRFHGHGALHRQADHSPQEKEAAFNQWYNDTHCAQFLRYPGAVSVRRYKAIMREDTDRYMAVSEVKDEKTFHARMKSGHMKALRGDDDRWFGKVSERARFAYTQVWPMLLAVPFVG